MMSITVANADAVIADLNGMQGKVMRGAVRSMNRAIASGRTAMVREIARDTGLKSGDVRDALPIRNATSASPRAAFGATLRRIPLIYFKARVPKRKGGVSYSLAGGKSYISNAFIATMPSGHQGVFTRRGKKRLPIVELFGPSLGHVFAKYRPIGIQRTKDAFDTAFAHELSRLADKQEPADV
jgi:hypothetical protein